MTIDHSPLTKGQIRKLNALRKIHGNDIAEDAFSKWMTAQTKTPKEVRDPVADAMRYKNITQKIRSENPPNILLYGNGKAVYKRSCKIRTPCNEIGLTWIPKWFLPWRDAEEFLKVKLHLEMLILGDFVPGFLNLIEDWKDHPPVSLIADYVDEQLFDDEGSEDDELYDHRSGVYYSKWELGGYESFSESDGNVDDGEFLDKWIEDENGIVSPGELKFFSIRHSGRLSVSGGEVLLDNFGLPSLLDETFYPNIRIRFEDEEKSISFLEFVSEVF